MSDIVALQKVKVLKTKEYGDFQSPFTLTNSVCKLIAENDFEPTILIEPSCGKGNFIVSALNRFPSIKKINAKEKQEHNKEELIYNLIENSITLESKKLLFLNSSFFDVEFFNFFKENNIQEQDHTFLILGNPPWVTNSFLGSINSSNIPTKNNKKTKFKGLDALTGKSNFDIAEYFITKLTNYFKNKRFFLAMVCKTATTQNIVKNSFKFSSNLELSSYLFDTKKIFDISAQANVFVIRNSNEKGSESGTCKVLSLDNESLHEYSFGYSNDFFVSNIELYNQMYKLEGNFIYQWRQGIKHDASSVVVLEKISNGLYKNKFQEQVQLEDELIYPFLKSSDLKKEITSLSRYFVIMTQTKLGEDTTTRLKQYPNIWNYLNRKKDFFLKRKSKIYLNQNDFCMFGVGEYSFQLFKIVVSGFYKNLQFSLILPIRNKPVMIDDTCYSLSFSSLVETVFIWLLLHSQNVQRFFASIVFLENKRPYKKDILQRLNLQRLIQDTSDSELKNIWSELPTKTLPLTFEQVLKFKSNYKIEDID